jgi:hypothetical protein
MPYTSPLEVAATVAAAKVRSQITRRSHDRYPWLFISPISKADVRPVVQCLLEVLLCSLDGNVNTNKASKDNEKLKSVSNETGIIFHEDPWRAVVDYYPVVWTKRAGKLESPFPGKYLVIVGLEYMDHNNGCPNIKQGSLSTGDYVVVSGDSEMQLTEQGGGTSLFILLSLN